MQKKSAKKCLILHVTVAVLPNVCFCSAVSSCALALIVFRFLVLLCRWLPALLFLNILANVLPVRHQYNSEICTQTEINRKYVLK